MWMRHVQLQRPSGQIRENENSRNCLTAKKPQGHHFWSLVLLSDIKFAVLMHRRALQGQRLTTTPRPIPLHRHHLHRLLPREGICTFPISADFVAAIHLSHSEVVIPATEMRNWN